MPVAQKGEAAAFKDGRLQPPVRVGEAGDSLALTMAAGDPVVTNSTAATATVVKSSGAKLTVSLPTTVKQAGRGGVLAPAATDGKTVPLLVPGAGSLVTVDTDTGRYSSTRLAMPKHRYRPPQMLGAKVYIPDETAGALLVYDAAENRFEKPVPVAGRPSRLDVFVRDGMLWANDPSGPHAVVIDREGAGKGVDKYKDRVPGGQNRPAHPAARRRRGPAAAPHPAAAVPAADAAGPRRTAERAVQHLGHARLGHDADRLPARAGRRRHRVRAEGRPVRPDREPVRDPAGAGPFTFTVSGGDCGREYRFRVAVRYRDARGRTREQVSAASDPVRPCVTPGTPTGLKAKATAAGAEVAWSPPPGGERSATSSPGPARSAAP